MEPVNDASPGPLSLQVESQVWRELAFATDLAADLRLNDAVKLSAHVGAAYDALSRRARLVRTWGDCYGYLLLSSGWADIMCDPVLSPWDIAALIPVVRGAGGTISDWKDRDAVGADSLLAAATPELHAAALAVLNP